ncbi:beta-alanyl-dopamine/carcinine hydrolase isoform X2 [Cylas formicarius]|uniref:beta-alanyl-dopamine/carcinine hydrolase isoform X2 n=1 Tax=Cylas formicarius TaxID=197179 RepID=UPI0029584290|nr:beta-alanyl-dopamine/carcinine hydrolase isoform X2 [Cylas formicarius]
MPSENLGRRHCVPVLYTRGTHYEVGYDVGRTFSGVIQSFLRCSESLPEFLDAYETAEGRRAYDDTLACLKANFPQYVRELEGTADGANVPFHKLFLHHMDNIILHAARKRIIEQPTGCSTICVNQDGQELLGHTEDALASTLNHFYFVSAHIVSDKPLGKWGVKEERFTSLCYAGHLPGYTMSYNHHGLVFSINTLSAKHLRPGKTPRHFVARALLTADNFERAQKILRDAGCGAGDGCSVNMTFLRQDGDRLFHNAEMAPAADKSDESQLNILTASPGEHIVHCNSYQRMQVEEANKSMTDSSVARLATFQKYRAPKNESDLKKMLSDRSHPTHQVFRDGKDDYVKTICVGIFDCVAKTWSLYADRPSETEPLVVLPLALKT